MARLIRKRDGEGFSGSVVNALLRENAECIGHEPIVGACLFIGTVTASTFGDRDWWVTTEVTEIISEDNEMIVFKTSNSEYTLYK